MHQEPPVEFVHDIRFLDSPLNASQVGISLIYKFDVMYVNEWHEKY
jgi:hypothetical protein